MTYLNDDVRKQLERVLDRAQQRLDTLRQTVESTNPDDDGSALRIAIGDAMAPLQIAAEIAEPLA
ncbi:hypothetical protein QYS36_20445 [Pseudomonas sp. G34]|uniref:hypothetical protein n=1 Tax=Pseudomonas sp. G34 TaxID=3059083 RepID=UPI0028085C19|nr:hypothetical protein [Pseudomonas sp. G34]MDQ7987318.1 hypothetical protein [Pseudomonas sp. G34]